MNALLDYLSASSELLITDPLLPLRSTADDSACQYSHQRHHGAAYRRNQNRQPSGHNRTISCQTARGECTASP